MVKAIVNSVFDLLRPRFKSFPDDYLVFDVETTGMKLGEDLVAQLGYAKVRNRLLVDRGSVFLDWTRHPGVDQAWLADRVARTRRYVESRNGTPTGRTYKVSLGSMSLGMDPVEALRRYLHLFLANRDESGFAVAHNGYKFDARFVAEHFSTFLGVDFGFGDNELFDTGLVEKATQIGLRPTPGESVRDFSLRVSKSWSKDVHWSLDRHCVPKYGLDEKAGVKTAEAHDAVADCLLTHALFEEYRREAEIHDY